MRLLAILSIIPLSFSTPCTPVDRDRILAADIASIFVPFGQLDPALLVGLAPLAGVHRTLSGHELAAIASRNGIRLEGPTPAVCFERRLAPLTPDRIRAAMEATLKSAETGGKDIRIEIVDFTHQPVPSGDLSFPQSGLAPPPAGAQQAPALWRGTVRYNPQHTLTVWASVRIYEARPVVTAARQIRYGAAISPEDIEVIRRDLFPFTPHLETQTDVLGRIARKTIPAGSLISNDSLEVPMDIAVGDIVHVVAATGSARITFDAVARSRGRKGDRILLLNPGNQRSFRALVDGKGCAHTGAGT